LKAAADANNRVKTGVCLVCYCRGFEGYGRDYIRRRLRSCCNAALELKIMAKLKTVVETELKGHCCKKRVLKPGVEVRG
jgi:hypothetical protein